LPVLGGADVIYLRAVAEKIGRPWLAIGIVLVEHPQPFNGHGIILPRITHGEQEVLVYLSVKAKGVRPVREADPLPF